MSAKPLSAIILLASLHCATGLSHVGAAVRNALLSRPEREHGVTWNSTDAAVLQPADWLLASPTDLVGRSTSTLRVAKTCTATDADCEPDFALPRCSGPEASCEAREPPCSGCPPPPAPQCRLVASTSTGADDPAERLCVGHSYELYDRIYLAIIQTRSYLDLSSLGPWDGRFLAAVRNAVTFLHKSGRAIQIRVMLGESTTKFTVQGVLDGMLRDVQNRSASALRVSVASWISEKSIVVDHDPSWNHAKIVAVDGALTVTGGHNMYTDDYLTTSPVLDVTMEVSGAVALHAHRFLDAQWAHVCSAGAFVLHPHWTAHYPAQGKGYCPPIYASIYAPTPEASPPPPPPPPPPPAAGAVTVFSVGRLGSIGADTSDAAIAAMFGAATTSVKLVLQDLGPPARQEVPGSIKDQWLASGHTWAMVSLCKALVRGVNVTVVLSQVGALGDYGVGWRKADVVRMAMWYIWRGSVYGIEHHLDDDQIRELVCGRLAVTMAQYRQGEPQWARQARCPAQWAEGKDCNATGSTAFGVHAKLWIVDDQAFYIGSQNLYAANLAEWGLVVDDAPTARGVLAALWEPLWAASAGAAASGPGAVQAACLSSIDIPWVPLLEAGEAEEA